MPNTFDLQGSRMSSLELKVPPVVVWLAVAAAMWLVVRLMPYAERIRPESVTVLARVGRVTMNTHAQVIEMRQLPCQMIRS